MSFRSVRHKRGRRCRTAAHDGDAGAPTHRAEPRIGELPGREGVAGVGKAYVGFAAIGKVSVLPVEAGFEPAERVGLLSMLPHS